jgi:predicted CopG family antitoxin
MTIYTRSLKIHADVLDDLKLVKRILGTDSLSDTIRELMDARGYDRKWVKHMSDVLAQEPELGVGKE